jgi:hypothetical protein
MKLIERSLLVLLSVAIGSRILWAVVRWELEDRWHSPTVGNPTFGGRSPQAEAS